MNFYIGIYDNSSKEQILNRIGPYTFILYEGQLISYHISVKWPIEKTCISKLKDE